MQKFEKAIVSGRPFKTESPKRRMVKRNGDTAEDPNDSSDSGSESESEREPPKVVSCNLLLILFYSNPIRITRGGVSWRSYRTKARTTTDSYTLRLIPCFYDAVSSYHSVASRYLLIAYGYQQCRLCHALFRVNECPCLISISSPK